ncbi:MAG: FAD-linked oxidase C-terminal domain-containing protein [Pseudomonadota bacterium]|nr:FAD-linked oxidase C-terminal domain-containing protein [Pseudomonadota bacterium]
MRDELFKELKVLLGDRFSNSEAVLQDHSKDESHHTPTLPDAVVFPASTEEVAKILQICFKYKIPVVPFGVGTSVEGGVIPISGGVCVDMSKMNRILQINAEDFDVTVEAGLTRKRLNQELRDTGLFFPIDPGADATIGGMASTRASGTNAVRYGTMRENILNLKVVLADGRIIKTGGRARKSAAGYDLARLFVGSEGTLGIITEITLRLYGVPAAISAAVCSFPTISDAVNCCILAIQSDIRVARIELLDAKQMEACNQYSKLDYKALPTLFFEFHGSSETVRLQAEQVGKISKEFGAGEFKWAEKTEERNKLWQARHDALYAALSLKPGAVAWSSDVCVPISRLADCIEETCVDLRETSLLTTIVGHVGDGNFHVIFLLDPENEEEFEEAKSLNVRMINRAIGMDGTCTGEHGIGIGKREYLEKELGEGIQIMRQLKNALDPHNVMNPGKVLMV